MPPFVVSLPRRIVVMSSTQPRVDCFSVFAAAEPSALPRVLDVFTLFGVVPQRCHVCRLESDQSQLAIDIQAADLPAGRAERIVRRLDRVVEVIQVLHSERVHAGSGRAATAVGAAPGGPGLSVAA
jgi:acetolactate synthase small subunit